MTVITPTHHRRLAARHLGYAALSVINVWILFAFNVSPGWEVLPFLTADTGRVLFLFNLSIAVSLVANLVYIAYDPAWVRSLGESVTAMVGSQHSSKYGRCSPSTSVTTHTTGASSYASFWSWRSPPPSSACWPVWST
jgi:hypothetical protein